MKRGLYWLGAIASLACLAFFGRALSGHWRSLAELDWDGDVGFAIAIALLLYLSTYLLSMASWRYALRLFGASAPMRSLARILLLSQIGKYLPGNLGHHVGRVVLARQAGLPGDIVIASMLVDTALVLVAGAACSLPAAGLLAATVFDRVGNAGVPKWGPPALAVAVLAVAVLVALAPVRRRLSGWVPKAVFRLSLPSIAGAMCCHALSFTAGGLALAVLGQALAVPTASFSLAEVLGVYAAAWVLGFVMPGSPAGLGVREMVLLVGLGPMFGAGGAIVAAALLRLVTTVGDGLAFAGGLALPGARRQ